MTAVTHRDGGVRLIASVDGSALVLHPLSGETQPAKPGEALDFDSLGWGQLLLRGSDQQRPLKEVLIKKVFSAESAYYLFDAKEKKTTWLSKLWLGGSYKTVEIMMKGKTFKISGKELLAPRDGANFFWVLRSIQEL
eukprot:1110826-Lingulodinium_polyedra.AAC.1